MLENREIGSKFAKSGDKLGKVYVNGMYREMSKVLLLT